MVHQEYRKLCIVSFTKTEVKLLPNIFTPFNIRYNILYGGYRMRNELMKFIIVGVLNTLHYYGWYLLFSQVIDWHFLPSHWIAFAISMIGSFYLNSYFTYNTKPTWRKFFQFPLTYIVQIIISTIVLYILSTYLGVDDRIGALVASVVTIPFTFVLSRKILKR